MYGTLLRFALAACACGIVAGCAGLQAPSQSVPSVPHSSVALASSLTPNVGKNLLYVSAYSAVDVYDYGSNTQVGTLNYFSHAAGSCTDPQGNVYVTNNGAADILEFAHGGSAPVKTFIDPNPNPIDCSVDPVTGDLAVINESGPGDVAVYVKGKVRPKIYAEKGFSAYSSGSYDASGNLLISGEESSMLSFAILRHGGSAFKSVTLPHSSQWTRPGYVRWDGEYFVVEFDVPYYQYPSIFEWYTIHGTRGIEEGYMLTERSGQSGGAFWLGRIGGPKSVKRANQLVLTNSQYGVLFYDYPEGGGAVFSLYNEQGAQGVTASLASKH
ncbi:MAG TPA: hypothetical protein VMT95_05565 [Candidatus Binatia bacterium]|nr:hypothetical protein [Candidatus Binatia bacterium]